MSKDEDFLERLRIADRVRKLLAVHNSVPDTPEGENAKERADHLIRLYKLDPASLKPKEEPKPHDPWANIMRQAEAIRRWSPGRDDEDYRQHASDEDG